jgi:hypothetical protein
MTNAVFTSLPMFSLCTFLMHKTVIKQIDKYRKHCLWRREEGGGGVSMPKTHLKQPGRWCASQSLTGGLKT